MINGKIKDVAAAVGGTLSGSADVPFKGVCTDSRQIQKGQLFVAIKGPRFDGHEFISDVIERGAAGVVISKNAQHKVPTIVLNDTITGLGDLAKWWRLKFDVPVVAITGSNGKTTTKEMLSCILSSRGEILKTEGNFNNLIGLPITVFGWSEKHWAAVLEMGMNAPGEIARLAEIARPKVGIITTVTAAHLEKLKTVDAVAQAKGELFEKMGRDTIAIVNDEDPRIRKLGANFKGRVISFGMQNSSTVRFLHMEKIGWDDVRLRISVDGEEIKMSLPVPGIHNVMNAMSAIGAAYALGLNPKEAAARLMEFKSVGMRLERVQLGNGVSLVNDTYNANPGSWEAALKTVSVLKRAGRLIGVLGEMLELGLQTAALHQRAGELAAENGIEELFVWGEHASDVSAGARNKGLKNIHVFDDRKSLAKELGSCAKAGDIVLVKGSRGSKMDEVVDYMKDMFGCG